MGVDQSTPIQCTPLGAGLYIASLTVGITCGSVNIIGAIRNMIDPLRYIGWRENKVSQQVNQVLYYHLLSLIHIFTWMRINGANGTQKVSLNVETISHKLSEVTEEKREVKVTRGDQLIKKTIASGDQSSDSSAKHVSTWVSRGPTKVTKTINIDESPDANGVMTQIKTETTVTTTSKAVNQIYTVAVGSEFEFTLEFEEIVNPAAGKRKARIEKKSFTYWIRALKSTNGNPYPDIFVHTDNDQPTAYQYLLDLKLEIPTKKNGQFNPKALLE